MNGISIYVEGDGDKRFIEDYIQYLAKDNPSIVLPDGWKDNIYKTKGWLVFTTPKGEYIRNLMQKTTLRKGKNLVIFDADIDVESRRKELESAKEKYNLDFEIFLLPNDKSSGALEELLEKLINPENKCILECWKHYEEELKQQIISWKSPNTPTTPSSKSKIYAYLEALVGTSFSEKEKIKDPKRDFTNNNHWHLNAPGGNELRIFLLKYLLGR